MSPVVHPSCSRFPTTRAFSLVEVVLALGIVSFGLVSILGLIPVGLGNFREARKFAIEAGIAQRLAADLRLAEDSGREASTGRFYFDQEGSPASADTARFVAEISAPAPLEAVPVLSAHSGARVFRIVIYRPEQAGEKSSFPVIIGGNR